MTKLGNIFLLPLGAYEYGVTFDHKYNNFSLFAFFDERIQNVSVKKYSLKHFDLKLTKHIIRQQVFCDLTYGHAVVCNCSMCVPGRLTNHFYLYNSSFEPYQLYNVDCSGCICYGPDKYKYPKNLRQAYVTFWAIPFNADLGVRSLRDYPHVCVDKKHSKGIPPHPKKHGESGCFKEPKFIYSCDCPLAKLGLHDSMHLTTCSCSCCQGTCDCICSCVCCTNLCSCACDCLETEIFWNMQNLESYSSTGYEATYSPNLKTDQAHGVFGSQHPDVLSKFDSKYYKNIGGKLVILGFTVNIGDTWYIDVTGNPDEVLKLTKGEVVIT